MTLNLLKIVMIVGYYGIVHFNSFYLVTRFRQLQQFSIAKLSPFIVRTWNYGLRLNISEIAMIVPQDGTVLLFMSNEMEVDIAEA